MFRARGRSPQSGSNDTVVAKEKGVGGKLRGLFRKAPSDSSLPSSLETASDVRQSSIPHQRSASAAEPHKPATTLKAAESASVTHSASPVGTDETQYSKVVRPDIWSLAYADFKSANPQLFERCSVLFSDEAQKIAHSTHPANDTDLDLQPRSHATLALEKLEILQTDHTGLDSRSAKFRRIFEDTVTFILKIKDGIALAAAANPCATAAFTAVGVLLPLILTNTQENESALEGLNLVAVLVTEYEWKEKTYLSSDTAVDFGDAARKVYVAIYEYEGLLFDHLQHNKLHRLGSNIYHTGRWANKVEELRTLDSQCRKVTEAIADARAFQWKSEEQKWQNELLNQPRLEAERDNRRHLYCAYESAKNTNPIRTSGTLEWFLRHPKFLGWRTSQSSQFLWLTHDPGCGKSVLSKCLVDRKGELSTNSTTPPLICYFFFREDDSVLTRATTAIRALLHQILVQKPELYRFVAHDFEEKGINFLEDFEALWSIFAAIWRDPSTHEMVCILDAFDQCETSVEVSKNQRKAFAQKLTQLYDSLRSLPVDDTQICRKLFVTSRPNIEIEREFRSMTILDPNIRFSGDEQINLLQREVGIVVAERLKLLAQKLQLTARVREALSIRLSAMEHRSYLWVKLVFEYLESQVEITAKNVPKLLAEMPQSINQAYANLLSKVRDPARTKVLLQYVLAATNPLSLSDLNVLMHIDEDCNTIEEIELWPEVAVESNIRSISGLLVTIVDSKVQFIHQTVRTFLTRHLVSSMEMYPASHNGDIWSFPIDPHEAALALMQACVTFLSLDFKNKQSTERAWLGRGTRPHAGSADVTLFKYASTQWVHHYTVAAHTVKTDTLKHIARTLFDPSRVVFDLWLGEYTRNTKHAGGRSLHSGTGLMWAAYLGLDSIVACILADTNDVNAVDSLGRTALQFSVECGHATVVRRLLSHNATPDVNDWLLRTPLMLAVQNKENDIGKMLLDAGSSFDDVDVFGRTIFSYVDRQTAQLLGITNLRDKGDSKHVADLPGKVKHDLDINPMLDMMQMYITRQHENKMWQAGPKDLLVRNMKTSKSTGLSNLYDNLVQAVEALEQQDRADQFNQASEYTMAAFGSFSAVVETESPLLLPYIPRILGYLWSHKHIRLACTVASQLTAHSLQTHGSSHLVTTILTQVSTLLTERNSAFDMYKLVESTFDRLILTWTTILGSSHAYVSYITHVFHTVQAWFVNPAVLIPALTSLAETTTAAQGPTAYATLQIRVDLARMHLTTSNSDVARAIAMDVCEQIVASLDESSKHSSGPASVPPRTKDSLSVPTASQKQPRRPRELPQNLRIIHLFLEALSISAECNFKLGLVEGAEEEYREILFTSVCLLGVMHSRTKQHRRSLAGFLRRIGKDREADEVAYTY